MTDTKAEIIKLLIENDNPEQAVMIFAKIIDFLKQNEVTEEHVASFLRENFQVNR